MTGCGAAADAAPEAADTVSAMLRLLAAATGVAGEAAAAVAAAAVVGEEAAVVHILGYIIHNY